MNIELTSEQAQAIIPENADEVVLIDPRTRQAYRLVRDEVYQKLQALVVDDSSWTKDEMGILAGEAFGRMDDEDYSHDLREQP